MNNKIVLDRLFDKYDLNNNDRDYLNSLISPLINNFNFQRRMTNEFFHHANITLGEHILEDSIVTYLLSKKYLSKNNDNNYRIDLAVKISMLHDLYTIPWQNNKEAKVHHFFSKHGFRHPIEATINAISWYPEIFKNRKEAEIIIDGILHHMFPLPVRRIDRKIEKIELKNIDNYNSLSSDNKNFIFNSLNRKKLSILSFTPSKYKEGKIMAKADRIVSRHQIKNLSSFSALLTGKNKKLNKKNK